MNSLLTMLNDYGTITVFAAILLYILIKSQISFRYPRKKGKRASRSTE